VVVAEEPILFGWDLLDLSAETGCVGGVGYVRFVPPLVIVSPVAAFTVVLPRLVDVSLDEFELVLAGRALDGHIGRYLGHPALRPKIADPPWVIEPGEQFPLEGKVAIGELEIGSPSSGFGNGLLVMLGEDLCVLSGFGPKEDIPFDRPSVESSVIGGTISVSSPGPLQSVQVIDDEVFDIGEVLILEDAFLHALAQGHRDGGPILLQGGHALMVLLQQGL
jgi:hypothetical protein